MGNACAFQADGGSGGGKLKATQENGKGRRSFAPTETVPRTVHRALVDQWQRGSEAGNSLNSALVAHCRVQHVSIFAAKIPSSLLAWWLSRPAQAAATTATRQAKLPPSSSPDHQHQHHHHHFISLR